MPPSWPQTGTIEFQDYGLQYRKGLELALKGISVHIQEREKVYLYSTSAFTIKYYCCLFFIISMVDIYLASFLLNNVRFLCIFRE